MNFEMPRRPSDDTRVALTLRDYFAARAPEKVPKWFGHPDAFDVPLPLGCAHALALDPRWRELSTAQKDSIERWMPDPCYPIDEGVLDEIGAAAFARIVEREAERDKAMTANRAARWFAWRWHYADTMLKLRSEVV